MVLKTDIIPPRYETNVVLYYFLYYEKNSNKFLGISSFVAFEPWNVYACSQPDESSVYSVLNMINYLGNDAVETLWINLREEPSVYHRWKTLTIAISTASRLYYAIRMNHSRICSRTSLLLRATVLRTWKRV